MPEDDPAPVTSAGDPSGRAGVTLRRTSPHPQSASMMADTDRPLDRSISSCFVCTGMGLAVSNDHPDFRNFTLKGVDEGGERVEITSLLRTTHVSDVYVRVNLIGRWVALPRTTEGILSGSPIPRRVRSSSKSHLMVVGARCLGRQTSRTILRRHKRSLVRLS